MKVIVHIEKVIELKTALCLSGQPRWYKIAYPYIKQNIIDVNPGIDVFFHTWHNPENVGQKLHGASWIFHTIDKVRENTPQELLELYKPKDYIIEPQIPENLFYGGKKEEDFPLTNQENISRANMGMFLSMKKANDLCSNYETKQGFKYDAIIRTRFDLGILSPLDLTIYNMTNDNVYYSDTSHNKSVISDLVFWSNSDNMKYLCEVYDYINEYVFDKGVLMCGENILTYHMNKKELIRVPEKISLYLVRDENFSRPNPWGREF